MRSITPLVVVLAPTQDLSMLREGRHAPAGLASSVPWLDAVFPGLGLEPLDVADDVGAEEGGVPRRLGERAGGDVLGRWR